MTFTFDPENPGADALSKVRFEVGDTDPDTALFTDEEIELKLSERTDDVLLSAADLCDVLATRYAGNYDVKLDGQEMTRSQVVEHYAGRAKALRERAAGSGLSTMAFTKVDGFSDDLSSRSGAGQASTSGRVRQGYTNPDIPV